MEVRITNDRGEPAPFGEVGEITVGSCFLARGYWGNPDLTQARFSSDPGRPAWRWYRTGDLGRRHADGNIEFLGRRDEQVKVRGFRVELGEIETVLAAHPKVRGAVTLARADAPGQQRLVAYVVPRDESAAPTHSELRAFLEGRLPGYMVPGTSVVLDRFPLTPSGKVDRRALPAPDGGRPWQEGCNVAPRNPMEDQVASIWREVLGLDRVGIHDNFFDLGGHSLAAARVAARLEDALQVEVRARALFETPTIAALAAKIEADRHGPAPVVPALRPRSAKRGITAGRR
jgi:nonribosomal peptide synthetase DhbF